MNGNKKTRKGIRTALLLSALLCAFGAVLFLSWHSGLFLPGWVGWKKAVRTDASGAYTVRLTGRRAKVSYDGRTIWKPERGIKVQDALFADVDGDGRDELALLCWRIGRYGAARPFWVKTDEKSWSQHLLVCRFDGGQAAPMWMASDIGMEAVLLEASPHRGGVSTDATAGGANGGTAAPKTAVDMRGSTADEGPDTDAHGSADPAAAPANASYSRPDLRQRILLTSSDGIRTGWVWDSWGFTRENIDITFAAFGDNLIHEPIYRYGLKGGEGFDFLYDGLRETIEAADVAVINQETPLTDDPSRYSDFPRFGTPAEVGEAIVKAGFDAVTCATNHAADQGMDGVDFTRTFFRTRGLVCAGTQTKAETEYRPYETIVRGGLRFAVLNYTYGTNGLEIPSDRSQMIHTLSSETQVREDIARARQETDFVLVFLHWGTENAAEPDAFQQKWTQILLESRADVVIGTHPHALQPCELLTGEDGHRMLVYYSLGNYVSAQPEQTCTKGGMARFTVSLTPQGGRLTDYELVPLSITRGKDGRYTVIPCPPSETSPPS